MSAVVATGATVPSAGYCAAKAGLAHATREQAVQWGRYGVRVNAVAPGMFPTEMIDGTSTPPDFFADRLVLKRAGTPAGDRRRRAVSAFRCVELRDGPAARGGRRPHRHLNEGQLRAKKRPGRAWLIVPSSWVICPPTAV